MADAKPKKRETVTIYDENTGQPQSHAADPGQATMLESMKEAFLPVSSAIDLHKKRVKAGYVKPDDSN